MKLVMTIMIRDEADIIEPMIQHHRNQGIDTFVVTDNGSIDGTWEILNRLAESGDIDLRRDPVQKKQQGQTVTRMAKDAFTLHGADWVINADADEFWVSRDPRLTLRSAFSGIPKNVVSFLTDVINMTGAPARTGSGLHRLIYQDRRSVQEINGVGLLAHPTPNAVHIGSHDVEVAQGNHAVNLASRGAVPREYQIEVLHFPWRSWAQFEKKVGQAGRAYRENESLKPSPNHHGMRDFERLEYGALLPQYIARHPTEEELAAGLGTGKFVVDHRVTDSAVEGVPDVPFTDRELKDLRHAAQPLLRADLRYFTERATREQERLEAEAAARKAHDTEAQYETRIAELTEEIRKVREHADMVEQLADALRARRIVRLANRVELIRRNVRAFGKRVVPSTCSKTAESPTTDVRKEIVRLRLKNLLGRRSVVDPAGTTVVTVTTHGRRVSQAHVALESIGRGSVRPARLVLWLDDEQIYRSLPKPLKRLKRRGLEVILDHNSYGVHTKYFPYLMSKGDHRIPMVTADDDVIYPREWLAGLQDAHERFPHDVVCYRAHRIGVEGASLTPYTTWVPCSDGHVGVANLGTSVSGQLFPAEFLDAIKARGEGFRDLAPYADDLWLHACTVAQGIATRQIPQDSITFPYVPGTQTVGLHVANVWGGGNDAAVAKLYDDKAIEAIRDDVARAARGSSNE
jgi:hypothetical protein